MAAPTTFSGEVWAEMRLADTCDVPRIHSLIYQQAEFELLASTLFRPFTSFTFLIFNVSPSSVPASSDTVGSRRLDLSASPLAEPEVAAFPSPRGDGRVTAGFVVCFPNNSTFLTRPGLYVEDIFVRAPWCHRGLGRMMLSAVVGRAAEIGMGCVEWCVLDWNQNAIDFYDGMGPEVFKQWRICRLTGDVLDR